MVRPVLVAALGFAAPAVAVPVDVELPLLVVPLHAESTRAAIAAPQAAAVRRVGADMGVPLVVENRGAVEWMRAGEVKASRPGRRPHRRAAWGAIGGTPRRPGGRGAARARRRSAAGR